MHFSIEWHDKQFNVGIAKKEGEKPFMTVRGCRIAQTKDGRKFVGFPATKNEKTQKWWNHVWANEEFGDQVMKLAEEAMQKPAGKPAPKKDDDFKDDIPF